MQTEPPKADPPKRKRRWLQFRLRTLMIGVALLAVPCGFVAHEAKIVRERKSWLEDHPQLDISLVLMDPGWRKLRGGDWDWSQWSDNAQLDARRGSVDNQPLKLT